MRDKRAGKAVAALAMGIVVAAGLVAVGAKESGPSLTYHELLVLAGDKTQAASAEQDLEAASGLPEAIGEEAVLWKLFVEFIHPRTIHRSVSTIPSKIMIIRNYIRDLNIRIMHVTHRNYRHSCQPCRIHLMCKVI